MIRDLVLTLTILAIVFLAANQPPPILVSRVDYCAGVVRRSAWKELLLENGEPVIKDGKLATYYRFGWGETWGPCSELDRYEYT